MHGIGHGGSTPQLATSTPTTNTSGGGTTPTAVAGASGLAASAPELGAILLQLTRAIETLVQSLGGAGALTQAPSAFAGADAAPVELRGGGGGGGGGDHGRAGRAKADDKQGGRKPKGHDHATDHGNRTGRGNRPQGNGNAGNRTPAPAPNPAPAPAPAPNPPAGGLSEADRTRLGNERDTLTAEARRLREQLNKYGGGAGTTTAVNRLEAIDRRLREINQLLG